MLDIIPRMQDLALDIQSFIRVAALLALFFAVLTFWRGRQAIQGAGQLPYLRLRQQRILQGWQLIFLALVLGAAAYWLGFHGEAAAYRFFPVTATPSFTPTPSQTPTISSTPTITLTPSETPTLQFTYTPTATSIPTLPAEVQAEFTALVTPNPNAVFSPLIFARDINAAFEPVGAASIFQNPIIGIYAYFSYDQMAPGVQWSAVWYRDGELVYYETKPWDGVTGGLGFSEWFPDADQWLPGLYQVQIFVGLEPKVVGEFEVRGEPPTLTPTPAPTATATETPTRTNTPTITPTHTRVPTATATPDG